MDCLSDEQRMVVLECLRASGCKGIPGRRSTSDPLKVKWALKMLTNNRALAREPKLVQVAAVVLEHRPQHVHADQPLLNEHVVVVEA